MANTGSGGGGGAYASDRMAPGAGGSGIVVVRISTVKVCQIGTTKYETFEEAVAAAKDGDTIELLADIALGADVTIDKDVTITSSGTKQTISRSAADASLNIAGNVAFDNVTINGGSGDEAILSLETGGVITTSDNTTLSQDKIAFQGQTIAFENGQLMRASEADGVMVKYTQNGTLNLPSQATADYLVVGGGGSGARGNRTGNYGSYTYYYGNSGDGGEVKPSPSDATLAAGAYTIEVGEGGRAPSYNNTAGNAGEDSSLSGPGLTEPVTAKGGTGGTVNGQSGYSNAEAGSPTPGTSNSITGSLVVYGQGGDRPKENANANTETRPGWGGQGSNRGYTAGAGAAGVVIINIKSLKDVVNAGEVTVMTGDPALVLLAGAGAVIKATSADTGKATVEVVDGTARVTGVSKGQTTVRVETEDTIYSYTVTVLPLPLKITLCEGDRILFGYRNDALNTWTLTVNEQARQLNQAQAGNQVTATLKAQDEKIMDLVVTADKAGDLANGDIIAVAKGDDVFAYQICVAPARVVGVGASTNMVCRADATKTWMIETPADHPESADEITATCSPSSGPSTTATLTGKAFSDAAYVIVRDDLGAGAEDISLGAVYSLKTRVVGCAEIPVRMSAGVAGCVSWINWADTDAKLTVEATGATGAVTAALAEDHGASFVLNLTAAETATVGQTVTFVVKAGDEPVVRYVCDIVETVSCEAGTSRAACVQGVESVPWTCTSSDPSVVEMTPVRYNRKYSAEAKFLKAGTADVTSVSGDWKAGYYFVRINVYDLCTTNIEMQAGSVTNIVVSFSGESADEWSWTCDVDNLVDVVLVSDPADPSKVTAQITAKPGVTGVANVTMSNSNHRETISVYVAEDGRQVIRVNGTITKVAGDVHEEACGATNKAWTARSMNPDLVTVAAGTGASGATASGSAGVPIVMTGVAASATLPDGQTTSQTTVIVENDEVVYIYNVQLVKLTETGTDLGVILEGKSREIVFPDEILDAKALDGDITVRLDYNSSTLGITGNQEGVATIVVKTDTTEYYMTVTVRKNHIDKHIRLAFGEGGTDLTYTYTFDRLEYVDPAYLGNFDVTNNDDGSIRYTLKSGGYSVVRRGNTVTFYPGETALEEAMNSTIAFIGQVDGLVSDTTIHYWVKVKKVPEGMSVLQKKGTQGYIGYSGTDDVHVDPETGDLILVFTNAAQDATIHVPDSWNVKMDILAIGGGGAGGSTIRYGQGGGGGGAGGFTLVSNRVLTAGMFGISVGKGAPSTTYAAGTAGVPGLNGEPSAVTNAFGYAFATAEGGGGGGAQSVTPDAINGLDGGSGGGAAWNNRNAGLSGRGFSGQGFSGGVPGMQNAGGGGGGAGGAGGTTGSAGLGGAGRTSDISGSTVMYAVGGAGGHNDRQQAGAPGNGPGFGGEGGSGAEGGAGADGIVVVRIKDVYRNIKVPIPAVEDKWVDDVSGETNLKVLLETKMVTPRFVWTEWKDSKDPCVAFEYEDKEFRSSTTAKPIMWSDAIASITGETYVRCAEGAAIGGEPSKEGVGYYMFTIRLKDGYAWEDGLGADTYGDTKPKTYRWAVVADDTVVTAAIDIHKEVSWSSLSNATVKITTRTSPESSGKTPNVLFLGGLCSAHGYSYEVIKTAVNTVTEVANLDYYFFNGTADSITDNPAYSGSVAQGEKLTESITLEGGNHGAMTGFSEYCWKASQGELPHATYDYIIFSFDRTLVATYAKSFNEHERQIAEWLKPYYDSNSVIWLVDVADNKGATTTATLSNNEKVDTYPWAPSPLLKVHFTSGQQSDYWSSLYYWDKNWGSKDNTSTTSWRQYKAMMSLFDPAFYLSDGFNETLYTSNYETGQYSTSYTLSKVQALTGTAIENQVRYDDPSAVSDVISNVIKIKPYNLNLRDKIKDGDSGLTLDSVTIQACTNGTDQASTNSDDWHDLMVWNFKTEDWTWLDTEHKSGIPGGYMQVDAASNLVTAVLSNVDFKVWTKVSIGIVDDGRFRTSEDAYYNQSTGKWEKNPNEGMAFAEMMDNLGNALNIEGEAETETPWSFDAHKIKATVRNGDVFVGGRTVTELDVAEHAECKVYYRGFGGYQLKEIVVDGEAVSIEAFQGHYTFSDVTSDHLIEIVYETFVTGAESSPVTNVYDGVVHPYDVSVYFPTNEFGHAIEHPDVEVRFAPLDRIDDDSAWTNAAAFCEIYGTNVPQWVESEYTDVGDHEFAYRVYAKQLGYGESITDEGWVWVKLDCMGSDHSVILPHPLTVRPDNSPLIYATNDLPHIDFGFNGFIDGENLGNIGEGDVTNGWYVTSTYVKGMGMGLYPTWVRDAANESLWNGKSDWIDPTEINKDKGLYNFGNYYLVTATNGQPVEKLPIAIGGVDQMPGLDPESPFTDTGVDPAWKLYDGIQTNIFVDVTSINPSNDNVMVEGVDYTIRYALADVADPSSPTNAWGEANPGRLHAGTNVVWYWVEPIGLMTNVYFAASNYQYVVVNPRKLVLESESATWKFDGAVHSLNKIHEVTEEGDGLAPGDTLTTNTTATILHVGKVENAFDWAITGDSVAGDYTVVTRTGALEVTPRYMVIGGEDYDPTGRDDDPDLPGIYWHSGVEDAVRVYDGIGTNIFVNVDVPEDPSRFKIYYTTNMTETAEWSETNPVFTNVTDQAVWFRVEAIGEWARDYVAVTNFARVIITPRTATVTANDAATSVGVTAEPPYTATVTGDFAACDVGHEYELIRWDAISTTNFAECVKKEGTYEGVIVPTGVATQGNYAVTYVPANLVVTALPVVYSLWITDHADVGDGKVKLAFNMTLSKGEVTGDFVTGVREKIYVVCAPTEAGLAAAKPQKATFVSYDAKKNWVWIEVSDYPSVTSIDSGKPLVWKILIKRN